VNDRHAGDGALPSGQDASRIRVVAAALYDTQGRVLIAERPAGKPLAGRWEFPGGKIAAGESERDALARELEEELGIRVTAARPFMTLQHDYAERRVELAMWIVEAWSGAAHGLDGQRLRWVHPDALAHENILEADRPFIEALQRLRAPA
jgi:8-oxo-dGTP diphosphatase